MDDAAELRDYVAQKVCEEHNLDPAHASRLRGRSVSELRADAVQLRKALGLDPEPEPARRDDGGRFAASPNDVMNRKIREALYGGNVRPAPHEEELPADGLLGAGRGHTVPPPRREDMNTLIRRASGRA